MKKMKPILFSTEMVRAILSGNKTQTRRIIKPQPEIMINIKESGVYFEDNFGKWDRIETNSELAKQRLYGRNGREHIFKDFFCWLWEKEIYGMVSISYSQKFKGLCTDLYIPQWEEKNNVGSPSYLHGVSRNDNTKITSEAFRRKQSKQCSNESMLGNKSRELGRQEKARARNQWRETPNVEIDRYSKNGNPRIINEREKPTRDCENIRCNSIYYMENFKQNSISVGTNFWVRETWTAWDDISKYVYRADLDMSPEAKEDSLKLFGVKWKPSIFMPNEAARIFLKVTDVRVEKICDISESDCIAEGAPIGMHKETCMKRNACIKCNSDCPIGSKAWYRQLWDKINAKRGYPWEDNPWVFVYHFERVEKPTNF